MSFQKKLLSWFDDHQRPLPWRAHYRPYEVWVSEIMLQQTQVETALPYYERWFKTFPTIASLAKAGEKKVLKHWEGLGYYSRARILSLKGIGPYSAGAIASIAFNQDRPIVDGNVLRVLSRVYAVDKPVDDLKHRGLFWKLQEKLIPKGKARYFNQALMELGALVCAKQNPACLRCPISSECKAFKAGTVDKYPVRNKRRGTVKVEAAALVLEKEGKFFIHRRPLGAIMGGLWEFPEWKNTKKPLPKKLGLKLDKLRSLTTIKRNYTHHLESLRVFHATTDSKPATDWPSAWADKRDLKKYPFSSAHAKIASLL